MKDTRVSRVCRVCIFRNGGTSIAGTRFAARKGGSNLGETVRQIAAPFLSPSFLRFFLTSRWMPLRDRNGESKIFVSKIFIRARKYAAR